MLDRAKLRYVEYPGTYMIDEAAKQVPWRDVLRADLERAFMDAAAVRNHPLFAELPRSRER